MTEIFNANTIWNKTGKPPLVQVDKLGRIGFSVEAVKLLGLNPADKLSFKIDYCDSNIIYFFVDNKNGIKLNAITFNRNTGVRLELYCRPLTKKLLDFFGFKDNKTFDVSSDKVDGKYWFILKDRVHRPIKWRKKSTEYVK